VIRHALIEDLHDAGMADRVRDIPFASESPSRDVVDVSGAQDLERGALAVLRVRGRVDVRGGAVPELLVDSPWTDDRIDARVRGRRRGWFGLDVVDVHATAPGVRELLARIAPPEPPFPVSGG